MKFTQHTQNSRCGKYRGRAKTEALWAAILATPDGIPFDCLKLAHTARCSTAYARRYVEALTAAGYLERAARRCHGGGVPNRYRLTQPARACQEAPQLAGGNSKALGARWLSLIPELPLGAPAKKKG